MAPDLDTFNALTGNIISAAIEVHRTLGPGLLESIYERCLAHELQLRGLNVQSQRVVRIKYKDMVFDESLRFDLLVESSVLVEVKAVETVLPIHQAQVISYLKLLELPLGLLINFHECKLVDGIQRLSRPGSRSYSSGNETGGNRENREKDVR